MVPLQPTALSTGSSSAITGLQRFSATRLADGSVIIAFLVGEEGFAEAAPTTEYRWSSPHGVTTGHGQSLVGVTAGPCSVSPVVLKLTGQHGPVTLDDFRDGATLTLRWDVFGLWMDRAPDDPTVFQDSAEPLFWNFDPVVPDAECLRSAP